MLWDCAPLHPKVVYFNIAAVVEEQLGGSVNNMVSEQ